MSKVARQPRPYVRGRLATFLEGMRYGGGVGQWSSLVHRWTGIGILIYLVAHITDTFFVIVSPELYDHTMALYAGVVDGTLQPLIRWAFRLGELGLFACVLFHALNGLRVISFDFWPDTATKHQKTFFWVVFWVFVALMVPVSAWMISEIFHAPTNLLR
jgi:succinate dehydrogenase / fumarate reductase cytochrome b subunit